MDDVFVWRLPANENKEYISSNVKNHCFKNKVSLCGRYFVNAIEEDEIVDDIFIYNNLQYVCKACYNKRLRLLNSKPRKTIAEHMRDILLEKGYESVSYGDLDEIHECAERSGMYDRVKNKRGSHPLNIINKVLNGLEKSELFEKGYKTGNGGRDIRWFTLK